MRYTLIIVFTNDKRLELFGVKTIKSKKNSYIISDKSIELRMELKKKYVKSIDVDISAPIIEFGNNQ